jgi:hypothetical protein
MSILATVCALLYLVLIIVASGSRTSNIRAIKAVIAGVAPAESVQAYSMLGTIFVTVKYSKSPEVVQDLRFFGGPFIGRTIYFPHVTQTTINKQGVVRSVNKN